jgi:hypothetical protein
MALRKIGRRAVEFQLTKVHIARWRLPESGASSARFKRSDCRLIVIVHDRDV